jgi:hypothetical protein
MGGVEDAQYMLAAQGGHWVPLPVISDAVPGEHGMQVEELIAWSVRE